MTSLEPIYWFLTKHFLHLWRELWIPTSDKCFCSLRLRKSSASLLWEWCRNWMNPVLYREWPNPQPNYCSIRSQFRTHMTRWPGMKILSIFRLSPNKPVWTNTTPLLFLSMALSKRFSSFLDRTIHTRSLPARSTERDLFLNVLSRTNLWIVSNENIYFSLSADRQYDVVEIQIMQLCLYFTILG